VPTHVQFTMAAGKLCAMNLNPRVEAGHAYLLRCC